MKTQEFGSNHHFRATAPVRRLRLPARGTSDDDRLLAELTRRLRAAGFFASCERSYRRRLALLVPLFALAFAGLLRFPRGLPWILIVLATGLLSVQLGIIAHDAGHRTVDRRRWVNELWGQLGMSVVSGLGFTHWRMQHNSHHRHCQDEDRDPDIQYGFVLSTHPRAAARKRGPARLLLPWQAHYFWIVAVLFYPYALRYESLRSLRRRPRATRVDRLTLLAHYLLWLGLPALVVGPAAALASYVATTLVVGALLTALFSTNHLGMPSLGPGERPSYLRQQVETSRNIDVPKPLELLFGGLNYQIEHHLFPSVGQARLEAGRQIVEPFCRAHGVAYHAVGFLAAQRAVLAHLRRIGRLGAGASAPVTPWNELPAREHHETQTC